MNNPTIHIANKKRTCSARLFLCIMLFFVGNIFISNIQAQSYPVQVITQITPPYSVYLADYTAIASNKLTTTLLLTDIAKMSYPVKLRLVIEGDAGTISTSSSYMAPPIMLDGGSPLRLTGDELSEYFNPRNLDFKGYSRDLFLKTGALPEGVYRIGFQVLDYNKSIAVSLLGASTAWIVLNDPPIFNTPEKDIKLIATEPQNILFQWMPRHLGSPNSAFSSEYVFQLYEIWPIGRNPNEVVNATQPLVEKTLQTTTFLYSSTTDAALIPGRQYAYRVQARDVEGRDLFRNKGYSEVQMFTYGDPCGVPENIQAQASGSNKITLSWLATPYNNAFYIQYREANTTTWYPKTSYINGVTIDNLSPQTKYEYQLQGQCGSIASDFSEISSITTQPQKALTVVCGKDDLASNITSSLPLTSLLPADIITSGKFEVQVTKASGSKGVYSGEGFAHIPFMGVKVNVTFSNIHINDKFQVTAGRIVSVYNPNSNFIQQINNQPTIVITPVSDSTSSKIAISDTLHTSSPIDTVYKTVNGTLVVVTQTGDTTTIVTTASGTLVAIDAKGDTIAASNGQTITLVDNNGKEMKMNRDNDKLSEVVINKNSTNYFLTIENSNEKYRNGDTYYSVKSNNSIQFVLKSDSTTINQELLTWKIDRKEILSNSTKLEMSLKTANNYTIRVYSSAIEILRINVNIYKVPVLSFLKPDSYDGEFGFDDGHKLDSDNLKKQYPTYSNSKGDKAYVSNLYIPEISEKTLVKMDYSVNRNAQYDKEFYIKLYSNNPDILVDNCEEIYLNYADLSKKKTISITVVSSTKNNFSDTSNYDYIFAKDNKNNFLGKVAVFSINPKVMYYKLIYVNIGNGYRKIDEGSLKLFLQKKSHNQLFIQWVPDPTSGDTLDITKYYNKFNTLFLDASSATAAIMRNANLRNKSITGVCSFYITDLLFTKDEGYIGGNASYDYSVGSLFEVPNTSDNIKVNESTAHEFGHFLGFPDAHLDANFNISKGTSYNFMDYTNRGRNMWFITQQRKIKR